MNGSPIDLIISIISLALSIASIIASIVLHFNRLSYETKPYISCTQKNNGFVKLPRDFYTFCESKTIKKYTYEISDPIIHLANHDAYFCGYIIDNAFHLTNYYPIYSNSDFIPCPYGFKSNKNINELKICIVLQNIFGYYYKYEISCVPSLIKKNHYKLHFKNIGSPKKISARKIKKFYSAINKQLVRKNDGLSSDNSLDW